LLVAVAGVVIAVIGVSFVVSPPYSGECYAPASVCGHYAFDSDLYFFGGFGLLFAGLISLVLSMSDWWE